MKLYIIRFSDDLAYLEEKECSNYQERYEFTKNVLPERVFEETQLDEALDKVYQLNRL